MRRIALAICLLLLSVASLSALLRGGYYAGYPIQVITPLDNMSGGSWTGSATACYPNGGGAAGCLQSNSYGSGWPFMPVAYWDEPTGFQSQSTGMVPAAPILTANYPICVGEVMGAPTGSRPAPRYANFWLEGRTIKVTAKSKSNKGTWGFCINPQGTGNFNGFATLCYEVVPQNGNSNAGCLVLDLQNGAATKQTRNTYYVNSSDPHASDTNDGSATYVSPGHGPWLTAFCHLNTNAGCTPATQVSGGCDDLIVTAGTTDNETGTASFAQTYGGRSTCPDRIMSSSTGVCSPSTLSNCWTLKDTNTGDSYIYVGHASVQLIGVNGTWPTTGSPLAENNGNDYPYSVWIKNFVAQDTYGSQGGDVLGGDVFDENTLFKGYASDQGYSATEGTVIAVRSSFMKLCRNVVNQYAYQMIDVPADPQYSNSARFNCKEFTPYYAWYALWATTDPHPGQLTLQSATMVTNLAGSNPDLGCNASGYSPCMKLLWNSSNIPAGEGSFESNYAHTATFSSAGGGTITSAANTGNNLPVWFVPAPGVSLPSPLTAQTPYYTKNFGGSYPNFTTQICAASGCPGGTINFGSATGTINIVFGVPNPGDPNQICMNSGSGFTVGRQLGQYNAYGIVAPAGNPVNYGELGCFRLVAQTAYAGTTTANGHATYVYYDGTTYPGGFPPNWKNCFTSPTFASTPGCTMPSAGDTGQSEWGQHQNWLRLGLDNFTYPSLNLMYLQNEQISTIDATMLGQSTSVAGPGTISTTGSAVTFSTPVSNICNGDVIAVSSIGQYHVVLNTTTPANAYQFGDPNSCSSNVTAATLDGPFLAAVIPNTSAMTAAFNLTSGGTYGAGTYRIIANSGFYTSNSLGYLVIGFQTAADTAWNSGTAYSSAGGTRVGYTDGHSYVSNAVGGNINQPPPTSPTYWTLSDNSFTATAASICPQVSTYPGSGNQFQCNSSPTMLTFNGNSGFTCTGNSVICYSDPVASTLPLSSTNNVIALDVSSKANGGGGKAGIANIAATWAAAGTSASQTNPSLTGKPDGCTGACNATGGTSLGGDWFLQTAYSQANAPNASPASINLTNVSWTQVKSLTNFACDHCAIYVNYGGNNDQTPEGYVNAIWDSVTWANPGVGTSLKFNPNAGVSGLNNYIVYDSIWVRFTEGYGFSSIGPASNPLAFPNPFFGLITDNDDIVPATTSDFVSGTNMTQQTPAFANLTQFGLSDFRPTLTTGGALCTNSGGSWGACPLTQQTLAIEPKMDINGNLYGPGTSNTTALVGAVQPLPLPPQ